MGCGTSKAAGPLEFAPEKQPDSTPSGTSPATYNALDVKPPDSAAPPKPLVGDDAAKAELQRPTSLQKQATVGKLTMTAAGRRKTDTTRRVAVSAETGNDNSDAAYEPPVIEKAEDVQAQIREGLRSNPLFEQLEPDLVRQIVDAVELKQHEACKLLLMAATIRDGKCSPQPYSTEAATIRDGGCNRMRPGLQPVSHTLAAAAWVSYGHRRALWSSCRATRATTFMW